MLYLYICYTCMLPVVIVVPVCYNCYCIAVEKEPRPHKKVWKSLGRTKSHTCADPTQPYTGDLIPWQIILSNTSLSLYLFEVVRQCQGERI